MDLVLSNLRAIDTTIEQHAHTESDQDTLSTEATLETMGIAPAPDARLRITAAHETERYLHLLQNSLHTVPLQVSFTQDLDRTA